MPCKIWLREDQVISLRKNYASEKVIVFAPHWVKRALLLLGSYLSGLTFQVYESQRHRITGQTLDPTPVDTFTLPTFGPGPQCTCCTCNLPKQSLLLLQKIARSESSNVSGKINMTLYPDITNPSVVYSLRDLVRQTVVCGIDESSLYGGYGNQRSRQAPQRVYVCDLAALQFQEPYNSGRLVLLQKNDKYKGILDNVIYENVVGEKRLRYEDVEAALKEANNTKLTGRYVRHAGIDNEPCFFDAKAYSSFVKKDVVLSGRAFCTMVQKNHPDDKLNFKFLKYGTGFFAGRFSAELERLILPAVLDGVEILFKQYDANEIIKCVELPFYNCDTESAKRVEELKRKYGVPIVFSKNDALMHESVKGLIVATTNCGDNHASCGNEMNFASVDAAIAENLASKAHIFSPNINLKMTEEYFDNI